MVNKVILIGNTGTDPEIRSLESGTKVAKIRLATSEKYSTSSGERKEHTEWHTVILWRAHADFAEKYIKKGTTLYIEGKIRSRERVDDNGIKHVYYEINADEVRILRQPESARPASTVQESETTDIKSSDGIPF